MRRRPAVVESLLATLRSGLSGLADFQVRPKPARPVLHFYLTPTDEHRCRRLRVRRRGESFAISLESKRVVREQPDLIEMEECRDESGMSVERAGVAPRAHSPVVSFIKNQHRFFCTSPTASFKVSVAHVLPFRADGSGYAGADFWHVKFEQIRNWSLAAFAGSAYFRNHLSAGLRELTASKWKLAQVGPPVTLGGLSAARLRDYFRVLLDLGAAAMPARQKGRRP